MIEQTDHIGVCETSFFYHQQSLRLLKHELFLFQKRIAKIMKRKKHKKIIPMKVMPLTRKTPKKKVIQVS